MTLSKSKNADAVLLLLRVSHDLSDELMTLHNP